MGCCRLLLALAVVLVHSGTFSPMIGGDLAVQAFFAMSGFYMSLVLNSKYGTGSRQYWLFLSNRLIRLLPTYWVILALSLAVSCYFHFVYDCATVHFASWASNWDLFKLPTKIAIVFVNLFLIGQDWLMFAAVSVDVGSLYFTPEYSKEEVPAYVFLVLPPAWSLGVELSFYAVAPFIVRRDIRSIVWLVIISFAIRFVTYAAFTHHDPWSYRFFPSELAVFLFGAIAHRVSSLDSESRKAMYREHASRAVLVAVCALVCSLRISKDFALLAAFSVCLPILFDATRRNSWDRFLGELSYPVYLGHGLIATLLVLICQAWGFELTPVFFTFLLVLGSLLLACVLNMIVERPIDLMRQRRVELAIAH